MNIKRPLLIITAFLLLFLLLFFICSDRGSLFKDDNSAGSGRDSNGIGYMKEITPGEKVDDSTGESLPSGSAADKSAEDSQEGRSISSKMKEASDTTGKKENTGIVKGSSDRSRIQAKKEIATEKRRVSDTGTAARKDNSAVRNYESGDEKTAADKEVIKDNADKNAAAAKRKDTVEDAGENKSIAEEKKVIAEETESSDKIIAGKEVKDSIISASDKKSETGESKSESAAADEKREVEEVMTDKPGISKVRYNRLDRIHLYTGEVLTGAVTERGDVYTIVTPDGIRKVASRDIQGNDIVK